MIILCLFQLSFNKNCICISIRIIVYKQLNAYIQTNKLLIYILSGMRIISGSNCY